MVKRAAKRRKKQSVAGDRLTVTLAPGQREFLEALARRNNIPLALAVRYVITKFIEEHKDPQLRLDFSDL